MTMLDVLKQNMMEGLTIKSVKELNNKYKLCLSYDGYETNVELSKACVSGTQDEVAQRTIITAMSNIYFNQGNYEMCKHWLDKLTSNE